MGVGVPTTRSSTGGAGRRGLKPSGAAYWLAGLRRRGKCVVIGGGRRRWGRGLIKDACLSRLKQSGCPSGAAVEHPETGDQPGWRGRERRLCGAQGRLPHRFTFFAEPGADLERLQ